MSWRIKATDSAKVGDEIKVQVDVVCPLTKKVLLSDEVVGKVCEEKQGEAGGKGTMNGVPEVVPKPITPETDGALFSRLFGCLKSDEAAFATEIGDGKVDVYYSAKFTPFKTAVDRAKTAEEKKSIINAYTMNLMLVGLAEYINSNGKQADIPVDAVAVLAKARSSCATAMVVTAEARA